VERVDSESDLSASVRSCNGAPGERLRQTVRACEAHVADGAETILVLIRYPHGVGEVEEEVMALDADVEVESVHPHAQSVITDPVVGRPTTMVPVEAAAFHRRHHVAQAEPDHEFLAEIARQTDRAGQVGLAVTEAEWKDVDLNQCHGELYDDFGTIQSNLRTSYRENGLTPPAQVLPTATNILQDDEAREHVMGDIDAVVIVDGEELLEVGRRYLAALTEDTPLTLVVDQYAAATRPVSETGTIMDDITVEDCKEPSTEPEHVVKWLLGTETPMNPLPGPRAETTIVEGTSRAEQLDAIARQIKQENAEGTPYEEIAVYVKVKSDIPSVLDALERHGIPVTSTSTAAFEADPVVREVQLLCAAIEGSTRAVNAVTERVPLPASETIEAVLDWLQDAAADEGVATALDGWAKMTRLFDRVRGGTDSPLHDPGAEVTIAETNSVYTLISTAADLLDTADEYDGTFRELGDFTRITSDSNMGRSYGAQDVEHADHAVRVDTMRAAKGRTTDVAMAIDLVDGRFETTLDVPTLVSDPDDKSQYPAVTDVEPVGFAATFPDSTLQDRDQLTDAYHHSLNRRLLGLVVRSADERLILGTYEVEDTGRRTFPTPVVDKLKNRAPAVSAVDAAEFAGGAEPTIAESIASGFENLRDGDGRYDVRELGQAHAELEQVAQDPDRIRRTRTIMSAVHQRLAPTPSGDTDDEEETHE
jgi:hypothetical protein